MDVTKAKVLKYALFLICDIVLSWFSLTVLNVVALSLIFDTEWASYIIIYIVYLIIRGVIITVVFKNLKESIFIYPTVFTGAVFLIVMFLRVLNYGAFYSVIAISMVVWWINVITVGLPFLIYNEIKSKTEKKEVTVVVNRYPYIETPTERRDFEKARTRFDDADADRKLEYAFFKEMTFKNIANRGDDFKSACIAECKESLESLANEGVYYLMHFISLGAILKQKGERVDFVGVELCHIQESKKLELLKCRINEQSYLQMEQELQELIVYYSQV